MALRERLAQREERISELKSALAAKSAQYEDLRKKSVTSRQLHLQQSSRSLAAVPSSLSLGSSMARATVTQESDRPRQHAASERAADQHDEGCGQQRQADRSLQRVASTSAFEQRHEGSGKPSFRKSVSVRTADDHKASNTGMEHQRWEHDDADEGRDERMVYNRSRSGMRQQHRISQVLVQQVWCA